MGLHVHVLAYKINTFITMMMSLLALNLIEFLAFRDTSTIP